MYERTPEEVGRLVNEIAYHEGRLCGPVLPVPTGTTTAVPTVDLCLAHLGNPCTPTPTHAPRPHEQHNIYFPYQRKK